MDDAGRAELAQNLQRLAGLLWIVRRNAHVERLAQAHRLVEREHALFHRGFRIGPVMVEDVDVLELHPRETLIEAGEQIFSRAVIAVRALPHAPAGLRRDDQLVAMVGEVAPQNPPERLLGRPRLRSVVVREIEVRDAEIECAQDHGARLVRRVDAPEVVPQTERDRGELQSAAAAPSVRHPIVACRAGCRHPVTDPSPTRAPRLSSMMVTSGRAPIRNGIPQNPVPGWMYSTDASRVTTPMA